MAQSRFERVGTIYTRAQSLMKGGALKHEDRPIWYDIYAAFPPKYTPTFDRPVPNIAIRDIFYKEDLIRAKFQKENIRQLTINLMDSKYPSYVKKFLTIYNEKIKSIESEEEAYKSAMLTYSSDQGIKIQKPAITQEKPAESSLKVSNIF